MLVPRRKNGERIVNYRSPFRIGSVLVLGLGLTGCARGPAEAPVAAPISVTVSRPIEREVTDYADFTARIAAVDSVEVRARVWGYLNKVNFKEGALVKKGEVLFEIDSRPYEAMLNQANAKIEQDKAQLTFDEAEYQRNLRLIGSHAVSQSDVDKSAAARSVDIANIAADKAVAASRQLDLDYTKVIAPVSGRTSRYNVTLGNLVQSGDQNGGTLLTTIVSVDPMYAYFDVDERSVERIGRFVRAGSGKPADEAEWPVSLHLASEEGFVHRGTINFVDNQINPKIGTLRVRGVFPNKDGSLSPGFFARVRVPVSAPHKALLVSDRALDNDQGQRILYVVNEKSEVVSRPIRPGALHDGLRAIDDGLKPDERVIVNGLQLVRPGTIVEPKLVDMPISSDRGEEPGRRTQKGLPRVAKTMP